MKSKQKKNKNKRRKVKVRGTNLALWLEKHWIEMLLGYIFFIMVGVAWDI